MRAEITERIGVAAGDDRRGRRAQALLMRRHSRCCRMRKVASSGMCAQAGRLLNSYSISYSAFSSRKTSSSALIWSASAGHSAAVAQRFAVALPIGGAELLAPSRAMRCSSAGAVLGLEIGLALDGGAGRVIDRAQEAGDVARRRRLGAPLFQRAARLALEIEDVGVVLGDQHLTEMEVAVMADLDRVEA